MTLTVAYVGNAESQDISVFALAADGTLTAIETVPVPGPATPGGSLPLAVTADRQRLYVALRNEPYSVVAFAIAPETGRLTALGSGPLADSMAYISVDATGRHLFGASYGGSKVSVNAIGADGVPGDIRQILASEPKAHAILADPTNRFVLATSLGGDAIHQFRIDLDTGLLSPNDPPLKRIGPPGGGPRHFAFGPDARFVYLLNELDGTVHVLPWDPSTGTLSDELQSITAMPAGLSAKPWGADIHVTPDGRFLYASERTTSTLAAYRIEATRGRLTGIGTFPTEAQPRAFAIDPSSRYLLSVGELSNALTVHAIDSSTGALTAISSTPVGRKPNWVEITSLP
jgi:6-phosphogluconolactonase